MNSDGNKILSNVFICPGDNRLQLAEIEFSKTILDIRPLMKNSVSWNEIQSTGSLRRFRDEIFSVSAGNTDGNFLLLIPGTIDAHVHFNTPGFQKRDDFEHGSAAAAAGGVTTVIDMPCTSVPPVTSAENFNLKREALLNRSMVDYALWGGISGYSFSGESSLQQTVQGMAEAGVAGFKAYFISGMGTFPDLTKTQMMQAAAVVQKTGKVLAVHAEDKDIVKRNEEKFRKRGQSDWRAYVQIRDEKAETTAVRELAGICRQSGCRIHGVHLSSGKATDIIRQAREAGLPFSAETCPHYLYFTADDFKRSDIAAFLKTAPPVKSVQDREKLWNSLAEGTLDFVTTDHAGCDPDEEKSSENFLEIYGGIPGVEHRVPFLFSEGFQKGRLTLQRTIELLAENPGRTFGLSHRKGLLKKGMDADFALINLWAKQKISADGMHSKGKYTPFEGMVLTARVEQTFLRGKPLLDHNREPIADYDYGKWIRSESTSQ